MHAGLAVASTVNEASRDGARAEEQLRAHTYSLLGALLSGTPSASLLEVLREVDVAADDAAGAEFSESWRVLAMAAGRAEVSALDDEYHALFIGLGRGEVMPYASWYLTGFLMDRPLAVLRADLAELGIERQADVKEPEDHAAALCETMAMLCASDAGIDAERRFFEAHLAPWMSDFFNDLQAAPSAVFYRAVGRFGVQFMAFESRYLSMMV